MNDTERKGCRDLLEKLSTEELFSLTDTVTKKQIKVGSRKDAIKAIETYSESSLELLKRKKIKRDTLFQYLADKNVLVSVSADKSTLVQRILDLWGTKYKVEFMQIEDDDRLDISSSSDSNQSCSVPSISANQQVPTSSTNQQVPTSSANQTNQPSTSQQVSLNAIQNTASASSNRTSDNSANYQPSNDHSNLVYHNQSVSTSLSQVQVPGQVNQALSQGDQIQGQDKQSFGETFARWFYKILNSHNPGNSDSPEDFGPHHFWDDSKMVVLTVTPNQSQDNYSGSVLVAQRHLAFVREEFLLFNPNISREGVFVRSSAHGMLIIMVCGTIHRLNNCLGTFEQMFGLVADPRLNDNWKIKITKLKLQSEQVTSIPKLTDRNEIDIKALVAV